MLTALLRDLFLHLSRHPEYKESLERNRLTRAIFSKTSRQFVAGETLDDAIAAVKSLNASGRSATVDLLGESVTAGDQTLHAYDGCCAALNRIMREKADSNISLKLTALGLDIDESLARTHLENILLHASVVAPNFVRIDMESSAHTDRTLGIYRRVRENGRTNVGIVLQSMLRRTRADLDTVLPYLPSVRLVKGAYKEPADIAYQTMPEIRESYKELSRVLLSAIHPCNALRPAFATHDRTLIDFVKHAAAAEGVPRHRFEFQMLYGFSPSVQRRLVDEGYAVRVYVPYGANWWPYFMRRLAERPQNVALFAKNLCTIETLKAAVGM